MVYKKIEGKRIVCWDCGMGCFNFAYSFLACFTIFPKLHLVIKENCSILQLNLSIFFFQIDLTCEMIKILSSSTSQPSSFIQATLFHLFFILFSFLSFIFFNLHLLFPFIFFPKVVITVVVFHLSTLHVFFSHFQINNLYKIM